MKTIDKSRYLFLIAALVLAGCGKKEQEAVVFTVSQPGTVTAEAQTVTVQVNCDHPWKVACQEPVSWAHLVQSDTGVSLTTDFNLGESSRNLTLVFTAGKQEKTVSFTQEGLSSVVKPTTLNLEGAATANLDIKLKQAWKYNCDAQWLSIEQMQGTAGLVRLMVTPSDVNENVGARNTSITIHTGSVDIDIPVIQAQTDVLYPADEILDATASEGDRSYFMATNVDFTAEILGSATWLSIVKVKSLDNRELILHFDENRTGEIREATLRLSSGSLVKELTVRQLFNIQDKHIPGVYGILEDDFVYQPGSDQWSWRAGSASCRFLILRPDRHQALDVSGIPSSVNIGDNFTASVTLKDGIYTEASETLQLTVAYIRDGLLFLDGDGGKCIIVKREDL